MISKERLGEIYNTEWCLRHRRKPVHPLDMLRNRELGTRRPGTFFLSGSREFYQCMRMEVVDTIQHTNFTPIRFTPDGQQMVCFNTATQEVKILWYNGVTALRRFDIDAPVRIKQLFTALPSISLTRYDGAAQLAREMCLITRDSRHMVLAYSIHLHDNAAQLSHMLDNNESVTPPEKLEHTVFLAIDLKKGVVTDSIRLDFDSIRIQSGVYLVDRILGILSVQKQLIYLYKLEEQSGTFTKVREIGRKLFEDDDEEFARLGRRQNHPMTEKVYTGFRQRFLTFLYKTHRRTDSCQEFLRSIHYYRALKLQRMQFLGPDLLLIRLGIGVSQEQCARREDDKSPAMFVIFDWKAAEILAVYNRTSDVLFKLFVNFSETFRHGSITQNYFPTTMEHCQLLREHHDSIIEAWVATSTPDSAVEVRTRVLNVLPCLGTGMPMFTPFLDAHYFSFEERILPYIENTRFLPSQEVRIFCRKSCLPVLSINLARHTNHEGFLRLLFHPTDPLVLLCDRYCTDSPVTIFSLPRMQE